MAELHALLAEFDSPERLIDAARRLGGQGWRLEAFTPFPVEGLGRMLGFADNRVPRAMLIGGATGAPRLHHPVFAADRLDLSADDRFFLAILADAAFDRDAAGKALAAMHPRAIIEVPA